MRKSEVIPVVFFGADRLPGYFHPLSQKMADLIRKQGTARCKLAIAELRECQALEKKRADTKTDMCRQIYVDEDDDTFPAAEEAISKLVTRFRNTELRRIEAIEKLETARNPTTNNTLSRQLCKIYEAPVIKPNNGRRSGNKRNRSPSNGRYNKRQDRRSANRGRNRSTSRNPGNGRRDNPQAGTSGGRREDRPRTTSKGQSKKNPSKGKGQAAPSLTARELQEAMDTLAKAAKQLSSK